MARAALIVLAACRGPAAPPLANVAPPPAAAPIAPPALATAGADDCRLAADAPVLGESAGEVRFGFDGAGGLAAWKSGATELSLRPIRADGAPLGAAMTVAIPADAGPARIVAEPDRFVVLVKEWAWQTKRLAWYDVVVDRTRPAAHAPVERAAPAPERAAPAEIDVEVTNAAVPPPPGPGGRIYEAMAEPELRRSRGGAAIGHALRLEWRGNSVAHGMYADPYIAWSGTHFLYPFSASEGDRYVVRVLAIDCQGAMSTPTTTAVVR